MNELFLKIINMSISAGWLVLAVLILRLVLKKAPKWVNVLLWGIVAVRLICPFSIESALSLIPSAETIPMNIEMDAAPVIDSGINVVNNVLNPVISASFTPNPATSANPLQIWILLALILWIFGMVALLVYTVISYRRLRRKVDTAVLYKDNIFQSENIVSPFVLGIVRPGIYLPFHMDERALEHVVAHEQAHICRKDHWWKPLGFLLLTIHWFNPLMWIAYVLLCKDIELACDEKVIKDLGNEQRADYALALVACSMNRRMIAACPLAFGEAGVKDRVRSVMNYKKPAFRIVIAAVVICAVVALCFLTNPPKEHESAMNGYDISSLNTEMIPTTANLTGLFDAYLYLTIDGATYRYERQSTDTESVEAGEYIDTLYEDTGFDTYSYAIYSVKGCDDLSKVLAVNSQYGGGVYCYSPSKQCDPSALQEAKDAGYVVVEDGDAASGQEAWQEFYETTQRGEAASVTVVHYYTLDSESCDETYYEAYKEDYPQIFIFDLTYDGQTFLLSWDEYGTAYTRTYEYLMRYVANNSSMLSSALPENTVRYILTHDATVTWEDLFDGMVSSQIDDHVDHYFVYADKE